MVLLLYGNSLLYETRRDMSPLMTSQSSASVVTLSKTVVDALLLSMKLDINRFGFVGAKRHSSPKPIHTSGRKGRNLAFGKNYPNSNQKLTKKYKQIFLNTSVFFKLGKKMFANFKNEACVCNKN